MVRPWLAAVLLVVPALAHGWGGRGMPQQLQRNAIRTVGGGPRDFGNRRLGVGQPKSGGQYHFKVDQRTVKFSSMTSSQRSTAPGRGIFNRLGNTLRKVLGRGGKRQATFSKGYASDRKAGLTSKGSGSRLGGLGKLLKEVFGPRQEAELSQILNSVQTAKDGSRFVVIPRKGLNIKGTDGGHLVPGLKYQFKGSPLFQAVTAGQVKNGYSKQQAERITRKYVKSHGSGGRSSSTRQSYYYFAGDE